jgi:SAM-dependent methyltransferase
MDSIYTDGTYLLHNPQWHADDSAWKAAHIARLLENNGVQPRSVCEIGCGAGEILVGLRERLPAGARFVGYDISPDAFALCSRKAGPDLEFRFGDLLVDDAAHFDVVMAIDVFEHVEDCFSFLRRLRTKARYKVFHIPLELSALMVARARPLLDQRRAVGHIHHFSKETALALLEDTGYRVIDHFYTSGRTELGGLGWKSKLLKWPRQALFRADPDAAARILGGYSLMVLAE